MNPQNNNNPSYPYQQIPCNLLNEIDPEMLVIQQQQQQQQALLCQTQQQQQQPSSQQMNLRNPQQQSSYNNQNPLQSQPLHSNSAYNPVINTSYPPSPLPNPNFVPDQPQQNFQDSVNTFTTFRYSKMRCLRQKNDSDSLLQGATINPTVSALMDIWQSLPLNFQGIFLKQFKIFSGDIVQQQIFQPLVIANPLIPQEAIFNGKVVQASQILQQRIRKNAIFGFFLALTVITLFTLMEIVYLNNIENNSYNDNTYLLILYIVGEIWMAFQQIFTLIAVRSMNRSMISLAYGLQVLYIIFSLVVFICGDIYMEDLYDASYFTFLIYVFGVLLMVCSMTLALQLKLINQYFLRLFVLVKQLPEKENL